MEVCVWGGWSGLCHPKAAHLLEPEKVAVPTPCSSSHPTSSCSGSSPESSPLCGWMIQHIPAGPREASVGPEPQPQRCSAPASTARAALGLCGCRWEPAEGIAVLAGSRGQV